MRETSVTGPIFVGPWLSAVHRYQYAHKSSDETTTAQHQLFGWCVGMLSREIVHFVCRNRLGRLDFASVRLRCVLLPGIMCIGSHNHIKWFALQHSCTSKYFCEYISPVFFPIVFFFCIYFRLCYSIKRSTITKPSAQLLWTTMTTKSFKPSLIDLLSQESLCVVLSNGRPLCRTIVVSQRIPFDLRIIINFSIYLSFVTLNRFSQKVMYHRNSSSNKNSNVKSLEMVPCCTATQFSSLQLFYMDSNNTATQKTLPNMVVEACGCMWIPTAHCHSISLVQCDTRYSKPIWSVVPRYATLRTSSRFLHTLERPTELMVNCKWTTTT